MLREKMRRLDRSLTRIERIAPLFFLILLDLNFLTISGTFLVNILTVSETKTAVFASGWDRDKGWPTKLNAYIIAFGSYCPITLRQNMRGFHTDWFLDPEAADILVRLGEPAYDNVVLIGHGSIESFTTKDGGISSCDIVCWNIAKKKGELIQHTCGVRFSCLPSLREVLLENPEKGYGFNYVVKTWENGSRAYLELVKQFYRSWHLPEKKSLSRGSYSV